MLHDYGLLCDLMSGSSSPHKLQVAALILRWTWYIPIPSVVVCSEHDVDHLMHVCTTEFCHLTQASSLGCTAAQHAVDSVVTSHQPCNTINPTAQTIGREIRFTRVELHRFVALPLTAPQNYYAM